MYHQTFIDSCISNTANIDPFGNGHHKNLAR